MDTTAEAAGAIPRELKIRIWTLDMFGVRSGVDRQIVAAMQDLKSSSGKRAVIIGNDYWWWNDGSWQKVPSSEHWRMVGPPGQMRYSREAGWTHWIYEMDRGWVRQ